MRQEEEGGPTRDELKIPTLIRGDVRRASSAQDAQRSTLPAAGIPSLRCLAKVRKLVLRDKQRRGHRISQLRIRMRG